MWRWERGISVTSRAASAGTLRGEPVAVPLGRVCRKRPGVAVGASWPQGREDWREWVPVRQLRDTVDRRVHRIRDTVPQVRRLTLRTTIHLTRTSEV